VPLPQIHRQRARPLDQDAIEDRAPDRETVIAIAPPPPAGGIAPVEHGAVGRGDAHTRERLRARRVHRLEHAQAIEHARALGREVLAADLRARELRLVEECHRPPALGQQDRGRAAGRPRAYDDDVGAVHPLARTAQKRKYGQ
jgi:hypothetical protein